ncbi:MAG: hypothetical protein GWN84_13855, partial [Gammaproteobacteria bacterium]|nr:hypothetical protein [Gammaproteobacteria bacterium]NIR30363.1 hypothetical protein [Gammaproteobacteria bacterium]NIR83899.1 hypothetical protein [Gammaproteobacteria bacterium]NIU05197.1 hypothetical protein [Gammaproteobacteria bacterium]NIV52045.1 hypothetical protein [Gammaproteobacteria bacterium]
AEIAYWLQCERFKPEQGAPLEAVIERAQRCTNWLAGRLAAAEDDMQRDLLAAAQAQASALRA